MRNPDDGRTARARLHDAASGGEAGLRRGLWLSFLSPFGLEAATGAGVDWIGVDLQHGDLELRDVAGLLRVAERADLPLLTRLPSHAPDVLGRALDLGVDGVIVPLVETVEQAAALVAAARVPPTGARSTGTSRESVARLGERPEPLLLLMIETADGLRKAADILAVPGVDGVFVGPYDLSLSSGFPAPDSEQTLAALRTVTGLARAAGRMVGFMAGLPALVAAAPEADLVAIDTDVAALRTGLDQLLGRS